MVMSHRTPPNPQPHMLETGTMGGGAFMAVSVVWGLHTFLHLFSVTSFASYSCLQTF